MVSRRRSIRAPRRSCWPACRQRHRTDSFYRAEDREASLLLPGIGIALATKASKRLTPLLVWRTLPKVRPDGHAVGDRSSPPRVENRTPRSCSQNVAMSRSILHVAEILAWADEHLARTGKFPTATSGVVVAKRDEKWMNIQQALRLGLRGLPGRWTLAQLLAERRGHRNRKRLPRYSLTRILQWMDAHKRLTGSWPTLIAGPIKEAPGETWAAVAVALDHGQRGLPGGSSIAKLLAKHRGVRNRAAVPDFSINRILRWADAQKARTGNWPIIEGGPIRESPGDTWNAVHHALSRGTRGLPGGSSLARLLLKYRGVRRHARHPPLSFDQILQWADGYRKRTGRWPKADIGSDTRIKRRNVVSSAERAVRGEARSAAGLVAGKALGEASRRPQSSRIAPTQRAHDPSLGQGSSAPHGKATQSKFRPNPEVKRRELGRRQRRAKSWPSRTAGRIVTGAAYGQKPQEGEHQG